MPKPYEPTEAEIRDKCQQIQDGHIGSKPAWDEYERHKRAGFPVHKHESWHRDPPWMTWTPPIVAIEDVVVEQERLT